MRCLPKASRPGCECWGWKAAWTQSTCSKLPYLVTTLVSLLPNHLHMWHAWQYGINCFLILKNQKTSHKNERIWEFPGGIVVKDLPLSLLWRWLDFWLVNCQKKKKLWGDDCMWKGNHWFILIINFNYYLCFKIKTLWYIMVAFLPFYLKNWYTN